MTISTKIEIEWEGPEFNEYIKHEIELVSQGFRKEGRDVCNHENGHIEYRSFFSKYEKSSSNDSTKKTTL